MPACRQTGSLLLKVCGVTYMCELILDIENVKDYKQISYGQENTLRKIKEHRHYCSY